MNRLNRLAGLAITGCLVHHLTSSQRSEAQAFVPIAARRVPRCLARSSSSSPPKTESEGTGPGAEDLGPNDPAAILARCKALEANVLALERLLVGWLV